MIGESKNNSEVQTSFAGKQPKMRLMRKGSILAFVAIGVLILTILGLGILSVAYGMRLQALNFRRETTAKMAAEAGYENAVNWLNEHDPMQELQIQSGSGRLSSGRGNNFGITFEMGPYKDSGYLENASFEYTIDFHHFMGSMPVYRIKSTGTCEPISRSVEAQVVQSVYGLDIGQCKLPIGRSENQSEKMYFTDTDVIDMPIHINSDNDRKADLAVRGKPKFTNKISFSDSRFKSYGRSQDKYSSLTQLFKKGAYFNQPESKIVSSKAKNDALTAKVTRFEKSTDRKFAIEQTEDLSDFDAYAAQIEFYINSSDNAMIRITNNCGVTCKPGGDYDYMLANPSSRSGGSANKPYKIYAYHHARNTRRRKIYTWNSDDYALDDSRLMVQQKFNDSRIKTDPGGQIYVDGNVIIGGETVRDRKTGVSYINIDGNLYDPKFRGKLTIVATGNIWIVNSIEYDGPMDQKSTEYAVPAADNKNVLGLFSQNGVVRVIDPGQCDSTAVDNRVVIVNDKDDADTDNDIVYTYSFKPVGDREMASSEVSGRLRMNPYGGEFERQLPDPMVIHAAITCGRGGFGAENVENRRENNEEDGIDTLVVVGSVTEVFGDIVSFNNNGYVKRYYFDKRLSGGILPGNVWLQGKHIPKPGGWQDSRL
jgi:hypothetical protein